MMKNTLIAILAAFPIFFVFTGNMPREEALKTVETIYKKIDQTVRDKEERLTKNDYISMYGLDNNKRPVYMEIKYPNDLYLLEGSIRDRKSDPQSYFGDIEDFVNKHNVTFKYEIVGSDYCKQPEFKKNEDEPAFLNCYVKKRWVVDGKETVIIDTVSINLKEKNIPLIHNGIMSLQDTPETTLEGMMAKATLLYDKGDYSGAASLYMKIVNQYPQNDDAWYNLGVMYYKNQGVGDLSRRQRLQKAYDCWINSNLKKACRAISFITDGREGC